MVNKIKLIEKIIFTIIMAFMTFPLSTTYAQDYSELELTKVPVLKRESRLIKQIDEAAVIEGLQTVLKKMGYDIRIISTDLGIISGIFNVSPPTESSEDLNSLNAHFDAAIAGNGVLEAIPDVLLATFYTKQVGPDEVNVLVQGRINKFNWNHQGFIDQDTGVEIFPVNLNIIYGLLSGELSKTPMELK